MPRRRRHVILGLNDSVRLADTRKRPDPHPARGRRTRFASHTKGLYHCPLVSGAFLRRNVGAQVPWRGQDGRRSDQRFCHVCALNGVRTVGSGMVMRILRHTTRPRSSSTPPTCLSTQERAPHARYQASMAIGHGARSLRPRANTARHRHAPPPPLRDRNSIARPAAY